MYFKQFLDERYGCASYLVASHATREAAVIDPAVDVAPYLTILRDRNFALTYVIDTHIHADHISGARQLAGQTGAELCLYESARATYPFHGLSDHVAESWPATPTCPAYSRTSTGAHLDSHLQP